MSHVNFKMGQEGNSWAFLLEMQKDHSALPATVFQNPFELFLQRLGGVLIFRNGRK